MASWQVSMLGFWRYLNMEVLQMVHVILRRSEGTSKISIPDDDATFEEIRDAVISLATHYAMRNGDTISIVETASGENP